MVTGSLQQLIGYPKIKTTPDMVGDTLEMLGIDFSHFDKCKTCRNSKDGSKIAMTYMWYIQMEHHVKFL